MTQPFLSVGIPTYNGAAFIKESVQSVLAQSYCDYELIIVDDSSIDNTVEIVKSFSDPRIKVFQNEKRLGLAPNWNRCIELSSGEFINIFHQDDVMLPQNLERKTRFLLDNPTAGFVYSSAIEFDETGLCVMAGWIASNAKQDTFYKKGEELFRKLIYWHNIICCPGVIARRECYEKLGAFDTRLKFAADWEMWMRMALFYDVGFIAAPLIQYRWHQHNETNRFKKSWREIEELHLAKSLILRKYAKHISDFPSINQHVKKEMVQRAIDQARSDYQHLRLREMFRCLWLVLRFWPPFLLNHNTIILVFTLLLGEGPVTHLRNLRRNFIKKIHSLAGKNL